MSDATPPGWMDGVSRVVVVDYRQDAQKRGRAYDSHYPCDIAVVLQDNGKTLKAFVYDPEPAPCNPGDTP